MQFDLKNAEVYFVDGYSEAGAINNPFAIGVTTILIDGHTGIIVNGTTFTIAGDVTTYTVTGHAETSGNTTSLTFTPSLVAAAHDNAVITFAKSGSGAINHGPGYVSGDSSIVVSGFTGIIPVGAVVTIQGNPGTVTVTSTVQTLGNTTTINFSPNLGATVADGNTVSYTYSGTGAVNRVPYSVGATTILVDAITGLVPLGTTFLLSGDTVVHTVTGQIATLGNTTSLTFTPGLGIAGHDDATLIIGGRQLKLKIGEGTMSYDEKRAIEYKKDRGRLDTVRLGDEEPLDVKLDIRWEFLKSDTGQDPTPEEVLKQEGNASDWMTSADDPCEPYAINIYVVHTPVCTTEKKETILLQDFRYESISHDFKQGMLSCSGKCNLTAAEINRVA
jgi:hypothetical protein